MKFVTPKLQYKFPNSGHRGFPYLLNDDEKGVKIAQNEQKIKIKFAILNKRLFLGNMVLFLGKVLDKA